MDTLTEETSYVVPAAITVKHAPAVSPDLVDKMNGYTDVRLCSFYAWYPNAATENKETPQMLIAFQDKGVSVWQPCSLREPRGPKTQLFEAKDNIVDVEMSPDSKYMVYMINQNGNERFQLHRYDFADGKSTLLTDGKFKHSRAVFSQDGKQIAFTCNARNNKDMDLYIMDPLDPASVRCAAEVTEGAAWSVSDWSPDSTQILMRHAVSVNESSLWLFDVARGTRKRISPAASDEKTAFKCGTWMPNWGNSNQILVTTTVGSEFSYLAWLDITTGEITPITKHLQRNVDYVAVSHSKLQVAYTINDNGLSRLFIWDGQTADCEHHEIAVRTRVVDEATPDGDAPLACVIEDLEWHPDNKRLCLTINSCSSPFKICTYDLQHGKFVVWDECLMPSLGTGVCYPVAQPISWPSFDNRTITGFMVSQPQAKSGSTARRPVIISIHGGPEAQWRPTFLVRQNYLVNELGVALVFPNIRGSTGFGKTFTDLDNGYQRVDAYRDIETLIDWLKTRDDVDPDRIGVMGGSYGGHVTLAISYRYSEHIACAVDIVGMSNLVTFLEQTEGYRKDLRRVEYGDERDPKMREFLLSIAPMNHIVEIKKPLLIVQGASDPRVPVTESLQMVAALEAAGVPVWYVEAANEGHGFARKENVDYYMYVQAMFLQRYLLD